MTMEEDEIYDAYHSVIGEINDGMKRIIAMESMTKNDIPLLERRMKKYKFSLKSLNINEKRCGFDTLIYGIEHHVSDTMLNYIIDNAPYRNFNYLFIENERTFKVPLFSAIQKNNFTLANRFIEQGANINYIIQCDVDNIYEEPNSWYPHLIGNHLHRNGHFKYYDEKTDSDNPIMYHVIITGNIIHYLCETDSLNEQNLTYIVDHGFNKDLIKPSLIRRLKIHKKNEYVELISKICGIQFNDEEIMTYDEDEIRINLFTLSMNLLKMKLDNGTEKDPSLPYRIACAFKNKESYLSIFKFNEENQSTSSNQTQKKKNKKKKRQNKNKRKV